MEPLKGLFSKGRLIAFPANIRLGLKWMGLANTVAYYEMVTITAVKSFIAQLIRKKSPILKLPKQLPKAKKGQNIYT